MAGSSLQVFYNSATYRWEVWRARRRLPERTHPSKESAVMLAVDLAKEEPTGLVCVYDEKGWPETTLKVNTYRVTPKHAASPSSPDAATTALQQPRRKSDPASSRVRS
jgi:hypothetical protein